MATEDLKAMLQEMLAKKKADKANEDQMRQEKNDGDRNKILENVGKDFGGIIQPYIDKMGENSRLSAEELKRIIAESVQVSAPNVDTAGIENVIAQAFANFKLPEPKVHVAAPIIPAPVIKLNSPEVKFPDSMKLTPNDKPFPVIMMDAGGKPMLFPIAGSSGPGFPMQTMDPSTNAIRVTGTVTIGSFNNSSQAIDSSGNPYSQANPLPVVFGSSGTTASALVDSSGVQYSGSNPLPTTASLSVPVGQGDSASALRVIQAGDSVSSVIVNSGTITTVTTLTGITNSVASSLIDSLGVQYSGSNPVPTNNTQWGGSAVPVGLNETNNGVVRVVHMTDTALSTVINSGTITTVTALTGITNSIATVVLDRDGNPQTQGAVSQGDAASALRVIIAGNSDASIVVNSGTITTVTTLTGVTNTVNVRLDTPDGLISAANPMQVTLAAGGLDSMFVFQARTTNATAVTDGADVRPKADKLGRSLIRPIQVRDLIATAYASLTTGAETTLATAAAATFLDLIQVQFSNGSTAVVTIALRAVTAGNHIADFVVPANSTTGQTYSVPIPQDATGNAWTFQNTGTDQSNTTISCTALFTKEI